MSGEEIELVQQAFADNWVAPAGPYLALPVIGIQPGDEVMVSTLTEALGRRYRGRHPARWGRLAHFLHYQARKPLPLVVAERRLED
jgi:hypothetical protein